MSKDMLAEMASLAKTRGNTSLSRPITPKKLLLMSSMTKKINLGICTSKIKAEDHEYFDLEIRKITRHKKGKKDCKSPIPEFAREFVVDCVEKKKAVSKSLLSTQVKFKESLENEDLKKSFRKKSACEVKKVVKNLVKDEDEEKEPTLHKIFRLYKPQILRFKDKSKIRVFSTVTPEARKSKEKFIQSLRKLNKLGMKKNKKKVLGKKDKKDNNRQTLKDYKMPAFTYGEKLWRLSEASAVQIGEEVPKWDI